MGGIVSSILKGFAVVLSFTTYLFLMIFISVPLLVLLIGLLNNLMIYFGERILLEQVYPILLGVMGLTHDAPIYAPVMQVMLIVFLMLWSLQSLLSLAPFLKDTIRPPVLVDRVTKTGFYILAVVATGATVFVAAEQFRIGMAALVSRSAYVGIMESPLLEAQDVSTLHKAMLLAFPDVCALTQECTTVPVDVDGLNCNGGDGLSVGCETSPVDFLAQYMNMTNPKEALDITTLGDAFHLGGSAADYVNDIGDFKDLIIMWARVPFFVLGAWMVAIPAIGYIGVNLMLFFAALMLFLSIPLSIPFTLFPSMGTPIEDSVRAYGQLFFYTLMVSTFGTILPLLGYVIGAYVGLALMGFFVWLLFLSQTWKFMGRMLNSTALGNLTRTGIGFDLGQEMWDMSLGAAGVAAISGAALGGKVIGSGGVQRALAKQFGVRKAEKITRWARRGSTLMAGAGGIMAGRTKAGGRVLGFMAGMQGYGRARNKIGMGDALTWASPLSAALAGQQMARGGPLGAMYATQKMKREAEQHLADMAYKGDALAVSDYVRLADKERDKQRRLKMYREAASRRGPYEKVGQSVKSVNRDAAKAFNNGLLRADKWDGIDLPGNGRVAMPQLSNAMKLAKEYHEAATPEAKERIYQNLGLMFGDERAAQSFLAMARQQVATDSNGKPITAMDAFSQAYGKTMQIASEKMAAGDIKDLRELIVGPSGTVRDSAFMKMLERELLSVPGGTQIMQNGELYSQLQHSLVKGLAPRIDVPISQLVKDISAAYDKGRNPLEYLQERYAIPKELLRGSDLGQTLTMLAQQLDPRNESEWGAALRSLSASSNPQSIARAAAVLQNYIENHKNDEAVTAFMRATNDEARISALLSIHERLASDGLLGEEERKAIEEAVDAYTKTTRVSEAVGLWNVLSVMESLPPSMLVQVDPRSAALGAVVAGSPDADPQRFRVTIPIGIGGEDRDVHVAPAAWWKPIETPYNRAEIREAALRRAAENMPLPEEIEQIARKYADDYVIADEAARSMVAQRVMQELQQHDIQPREGGRAIRWLDIVADNVEREIGKQALRRIAAEVGEDVIPEVATQTIADMISREAIEERRLSRLAANIGSLTGAPLPEDAAQIYAEIAEKAVDDYVAEILAQARASGEGGNVEEIVHQAIERRMEQIALLREKLEEQFATIAPGLVNSDIATELIAMSSRLDEGILEEIESRLMADGKLEAINEAAARLREQMASEQAQVAEALQEMIAQMQAERGQGTSGALDELQRQMRTSRGDRPAPSVSSPSTISPGTVAPDTSDDTDDDDVMFADFDEFFGDGDGGADDDGGLI